MIIILIYSYIIGVSVV